MKCKQTIDLMFEYVDGSLTVERAAEVERHLAECEECSRVLMSTRKMLSSLKSLSGQSAPRDCWAAVKAHAQSKPAGFGFPAWWRPAMAGTTAAAALAVGLIFTASSLRPETPVTSGELRQLIGVHSRLASSNPATDPYVSFVTAALDKYDGSDMRHTR